MINDDLDNELFICMWCQKERNITQGTFPQYILGENEFSFDADYNNREYWEFVCYDCLD